MRSASTAISLPAAVSAHPVRCRSNSFTPRLSSSWPRRRNAVERLTPSCSAAPARPFAYAIATQHGGQETTLFSAITNLMHFGLVIVGLPYAFAGQMTLDEITGGSPYGATTIAGSQGQRRPSENEKASARWQGRHVAEIAAKLRR